MCNVRMRVNFRGSATLLIGRWKVFGLLGDAAGRSAAVAVLETPCCLCQVFVSRLRLLLAFLSSASAPQSALTLTLRSPLSALRSPLSYSSIPRKEVSLSLDYYDSAILDFSTRRDE